VVLGDDRMAYDIDKILFTLFVFCVWEVLVCGLYMFLVKRGSMVVDVGLGSERDDIVCKKDSAWIDVRKGNMSVNGNRRHESINVKENYSRVRRGMCV
jgi:hypothetical protein